MRHSLLTWTSMTDSNSNVNVAAAGMITFGFQRNVDASVQRLQVA